ncbi:hypothetical protein C8F01DRAFT_1062515, partial [Mycena amicta]
MASSTPASYESSRVSQPTANDRTPLLGSPNSRLGLSQRPSRPSDGDGEPPDDKDPAADTSSIALVLENRGSVARDHLASERTFLAYVRTSLAVAAAGVALVQLFHISDAGQEGIWSYARPLAAATIILSLYVLGLGVSRYFTVQASLVNGKFPTTRFRLGALGVAAGALMLWVFVVMLGA